jgi:SulP family sulfate permease
VLTAMIALAHLVDVDRVLDPEGTTSIYSVTGELFFASDQEFIEAFDYGGDPPNVIIDLCEPCPRASRGQRPVG